VRAKFSENIYPVPSIAPPLRHVRAPAQDRTPKESQEHYSSNASIKQQADKEFLERCKVELANTEFPGFGLVKIQKTQKKPQTMIAVEPTNTAEATQATTPHSGRGGEKRKSATATAATSQNAQQHHNVNLNGLTETARKIDDLLESYTLCDQEHFMPLISKLLSVLVNWELQSDKELSTACKSILTLSESRMCGALTEPNNIIQMIDLLNSQNVPLKIQVTTVTAFLSICKKISEMKKIICDKMIHALIKIILASCDSNLIQNYDTQVIKLSIKCLSALAGKYDRKMYIPGETRDFDLVREFLINQGGITGLMIVSKLSVDDEIQEMPSRSCFSYLGISDWELQKSVLEKVKEGKVNFTKDSTEETEAPGSATHNTKAKQTRGFLFAGSQSLVLSKYDSAPKNAKANVENTPQSDKTPNIPKNLLERSDYPIDSMIADVEEKISKLKEQKKKREQEEEEKREQALIDQMKEQKEKEQIMNEKRKKAEEVFLKRLEEKKKLQEEVAKRTEEESKQRFIQEEERKKTKIIELLKKKEEYDKKTKKFEFKKKKLEEEMKKMVDEELEKKKIQRKALEESFWSRIKAKQKEKQLDKITTKTEETKRTGSLAISNIELSSSVDPSKSHDDSSDKTRMLRTHHFNTPQHGIEDGKAVTFSSFFKEDAPMDLRMGRHSYKTSMSQEPRQRSVEDTRVKKKDKDECVSLPCIDGSSRTVKTEVIFTQFL